jgi:hypothetical protein
MSIPKGPIYGGLSLQKGSIHPATRTVSVVGSRIGYGTAVASQLLATRLTLSLDLLYDSTVPLVISSVFG